MERDIKIVGDGNAIGDGNKILVDKRVYNKIIHQSNASNHKGGGGDRDDSPLAFILPVAILVAVAVACWKFAVYADLIFIVLLSLSLIMMASQAITATYGMSIKVDGSWVIERILGLVGSGLLATSVYWSQSSFPTEISEMAVNSANWKDFMCSLNTYGHQLATLHTISISLVAAPGALLLFVNSFSALSGAIFFTNGARLSGKIAIATGSRWVLGFGLLLSILSFASQTDFSFQLWSNSVLTFSNDPFAKSRTIFSICK